MNKVRCKDCKNYAVIRSGQTKNPHHGWCTVKSVYPMKEEIGGPVFPPGVKRQTSEHTPAKPEIVEGNSIVASCRQVVSK